MVSKEEKTLKDFYEFCLATCSQDRLRKIKIIIGNSRKIINKDLTKLRVDDVVRFLSYINQSDYKAWTRNDYKKIFKRFLKWHYKDLEMVEGDRVREGFKGVSSKRAFNKERINKNTLIKPKELETLLRTSKTLKWKALISLMYESGFRPCEIRMLKWKDLRFDDNLGICRVWTLSPKTRQDREIPVKDAVVHLKRWKKEYQFLDRGDKDFVFPSQHSRDKPLGKGVITEMFKRLCRKAKMRHIFPYMLRHTRIYELQKQLPEKIASKFAGHSIETSEIYNHLADDDVEESLLKIYNNEEITPEQKNNYEREIERLKEKMSKLESVERGLLVLQEKFNSFS